MAMDGKDKRSNQAPYQGPQLPKGAPPVPSVMPLSTTQIHSNKPPRAGGIHPLDSAANVYQAQKAPQSPINQAPTAPTLPGVGGANAIPASLNQAAGVYANQQGKPPVQQMNPSQPIIPRQPAYAFAPPDNRGGPIPGTPSTNSDLTQRADTSPSPRFGMDDNKPFNALEYRMAGLDMSDYERVIAQQNQPSTNPDKMTTLPMSKEADGYYAGDKYVDNTGNPNDPMKGLFDNLDWEGVKKKKDALDSMDPWEEHLWKNITDNKYGVPQDALDAQYDSMAHSSAKDAQQAKNDMSAQFGARGFGASGMATAGMGDIDSNRMQALTQASADMYMDNAKMAIEERQNDLQMALQMATQKGNIAAQKEAQSLLLDFQKEQEFLNQMYNAPDKMMSWLQVDGGMDADSLGKFMTDMANAQNSDNPSGELAKVFSQMGIVNGQAVYPLPEGGSGGESGNPYDTGLPDKNNTKPTPLPKDGDLGNNNTPGYKSFEGHVTKYMKEHAEPPFDGQDIQAALNALGWDGSDTGIQFGSNAHPWLLHLINALKNSGEM